MNVLVCVKRVPAPGARIELTDDGTAVDDRHLGFTISPHEECAVEEAVRIVADRGGRTTVLTLGPTAAEEQLRAAIAMGADDGVLLDTDERDWDPRAVAAAVTAAIRTLEDEQGRFDLVLFGNESADAANHQVGIRVAHALGRPVVAGVQAIDLATEDAPDPSQASEATLHRAVDGGAERCRVPLPAVATVREGINVPRYPAMRGRLRAAKAPIRHLAPERRPDALTLLGLRHQVQPETETELLGSGADAVGGVVRVLEEAGLL